LIESSLPSGRACSAIARLDQHRPFKLGIRALARSLGPDIRGIDLLDEHRRTQLNQTALRAKKPLIMPD
jgi:hypothetical protein